TKIRPSRLHPRENTLAGSGATAGANGEEILGCRRSLNPPGSEMLVLTIFSPPLVVMVRKLLPLPSIGRVKMAGGSTAPVLETALTVIVAFPGTQVGHCPPMNGLIIRSL